MSLKKAAALVQSHWMRKALAQIFQLNSGRYNKVVLNTQPVLALDEDLSFEQEVEMLTHVACQRILDRDYRASSPS